MAKKTKPSDGMTIPEAPPVDGTTVDVAVGHWIWPSLICVQEGAMVLLEVRVVVGG